MPLEPSKLQRVKHYTFRMYPTPSTQKEQQWKKCIIAIDESLRRKKKIGQKKYQVINVGLFTSKYVVVI